VNRLSWILALLWIVVPASAEELLVAAASDLAPLQAQLGAAFRQETGIVVRWSTGASGTLAQQIANGAPHDVFLSANRQFVEDLVKAGRIDGGSVFVYATGRIGVWSLNGKVRRLEDLTGVAGVRTIAIPNPRFAPYGVAARQALEAAGLWQQVSGRIVYAENVRQSMQYAESGNADAVITSWTLLRGREGSSLVAENLHAPIAQAAGMRVDSERRALAVRFLEFLRSPAAVRILTAHGLMAAAAQQETPAAPPRKQQRKR
jgi:molybdate transport system substrate-binding protein